MKHEYIFDGDTVAIEYYENENLVAIAFPRLGVVDIKFKPNADPKVKEMYSILMS